MFRYDDPPKIAGRYTLSGSRVIVNNEGDVSCGVEIDLFAKGSTLPKITNITQDKSITINGGTRNKNIYINTNVGRKTANNIEIKLNKINYPYTFRKVVYSRQAGLYVAITEEYAILTSFDLLNWTSYDWEGGFLKDIAYYPDKAFLLILSMTTLQKLQVVIQKGQR